VSGGVRQAVEASTRKIRMRETERGRSKGRSWKKEEREE